MHRAMGLKRGSRSITLYIYFNINDDSVETFILPVHTCCGSGNPPSRKGDIFVRGKKASLIISLLIFFFV